MILQPLICKLCQAWSWFPGWDAYLYLAHVIGAWFCQNRDPHQQKWWKNWWKIYNAGLPINKCIWQTEYDLLTYEFTASYLQIVPSLVPISWKRCIFIFGTCDRGLILSKWRPSPAEMVKNWWKIYNARLLINKCIWQTEYNLIIYDCTVSYQS